MDSENRIKAKDFLDRQLNYIVAEFLKARHPLLKDQTEAELEQLIMEVLDERAGGIDFKADFDGGEDDD